MTAVLAACGGSSESLAPTATVPQATTTTDPYAVPPVIDEAYVNRVLAALDHAFGDITRIVVEARDIPPEVIQKLRAIYAGQLLQGRLDLFGFEMSLGLAGYKEEPGDVRSEVISLISVRPGCVFAEISRDASSMWLSAEMWSSTEWVALVPADSTLDPDDFNPTPWAFFYEGFLQDLSQPEDPCRFVS